MDDLDIASEQEMLAREIALANSRKPSNTPQPTGNCLWCGDPAEDRRWCSPECAEDWDKHQRRKVYA